MRKLITLLFIGLILAVPISVKAAFFRASESGVETVTKDQNPKNAYIAGSTVNVDSDVQKDLVAAGSTININGKVEDDVVAAGNNINIKNSVGGTVRVAGSSINIDNTISEDLLVAANEFTFGDKSNVNGDLLFVANKSEVRGQVGGDVKFTGADIVISGTVKGNAVAKDVNSLRITKNAQILGKLTYSSPNQATIEDGAKIANGVDYNKTEAKNLNGWKSYAKKASATLVLYQIIGTILLLLLFVYMSPKISKRYVEQSFALTFRNFLVGLVILIVTPIISLILLAISFKLTVIAMLIYMLFLMLASSFSALLLGSWVLKAIARSEKYLVDWQSILLGAILVAALSFIPMVGPTFLFVLMLISFGALLSLSYESLTQ